jgi:hypothetical protein
MKVKWLIRNSKMSEGGNDHFVKNKTPYKLIGGTARLLI